jgi:ABC-type nickel/cobalt efflux system permease component RcnA
MMTGLCIPVSVFGFWLGNRVHYRVNQHLFRQIVFVVLTAVGLFMGWSAINQYRKAAREEPKAAASRLETDKAGSMAKPFAREAFAAIGVTHRPVPDADGVGCGS